MNPKPLKKIISQLRAENDITYINFEKKLHKYEHNSKRNPSRKEKAKRA